MTHIQTVINGQIQAKEKTMQFTALPLELQTAADRTSQKFSNPTSLGLLLTVVVANKGGTLSITPKVLIYDGAGNAITFFAASAAISANGTYTYLLYPGGGTNSNITQILSCPIPREWAVFLDYTGTPASDKADTTVYACYL